MNSFEKYGLFPVGAVPNKRQFDHLHYKKAFFHFGVNTFTNLEWGNGTEAEASFAPTELDTRQWMRVIKAAGFDLAIITAKHHDGFCLWPSNYTDHSVKNSPYKNGNGDIIREFTDAAHEYSIKVGLYISPWDRNSPYWGSSEYSKYYALQLKELMTGYGKIDEVWWDGAGSTETVYDWGRWASIIRDYQPDACIFGSLGATPYVDIRWVGNEYGYAGETHYASIDEEALTVENRIQLNTGKTLGERYIPSETDVSIRPGWFYHSSQDGNVRSVENLNKIWFDSVGRNSIMLLNFPPDRRGLVFETDARNAIMSNRCITKMLAVNYALGASITADSVLADCLPEKAALPDENLFYAAETDRKSAVIDILLPRPELINVLILGEEVRLGERITNFKVESVENDSTALLFKGTSVGFMRAVRIPESEYSHIRIMVENAIGSPVISRLGLHYYDNSSFIELQESGSFNLADTVTSKTEFDEKRMSATVAFGGIFPFDHISFVMARAGVFRLYAFSGVNWYEIYSGTSQTGTVSVKLNTPVADSYQVRIECENPFAFMPRIDIRKD